MSMRLVKGCRITDAQIAAGLAAIVDGCDINDVQEALELAGVPRNCERGLWQGDFLSPYLAARLLQEERIAGRIKYQGNKWYRTDNNGHFKPQHGWTCFHCGETFTTMGSARDHFGFEPSADPACRIKIGAERGLVMALRKAEAEIAELTRLLHDETSEGYRVAARQSSQHQQQLRDVEEYGYERGLADGRRERGS